MKRNFFFRGFEWGFDKSKTAYERIVMKALRMTLVMFILFIGLTGAAYLGFVSIPAGFMPTEDQGYMMVSAQLPDAASFERTERVALDIDQRLRKIKGVQDVLAVSGYSVLDGAQASNAAAFWVIFEPFEKRGEKKLKLPALRRKIRHALNGIQEARVVAFTPPAISGLGVAGGFKMQLQDRGAVGIVALQQMAEEIAYDANRQSGLAGVYTTFRANVPQIFAEIDRTKVKTLNIPLSEVFNTLQANLGSSYTNDFNKFGRTYQVKVQADAQFRAHTRMISPC